MAKKPTLTPPTKVKAVPITPTKPVPVGLSPEGQRAYAVQERGLAGLGKLPGKKAAPSPKPTPPQPTAAERAAAQRQNASLRNAKVSAAEGRVIESANRSEAGSQKPSKVLSSSGTGYGSTRPVKKVNIKIVPPDSRRNPYEKKDPGFEF